MPKFYVKSGDKCLVIDRPTARSAAESLVLRSFKISSGPIGGTISTSEKGFMPCDADDTVTLFDTEEIREDCLIDQDQNFVDEYLNEEDDDDDWG